MDEVWSAGQQYASSMIRDLLRRRIHHIVLEVPLPMPHLWLAALASLGEDVDLAAPTPDYDSGI